MAASQVKSVGGYNCEFIDPVSDDFICKVCNCVAREPYLTVCCGQHYCQSCITNIAEDGKPCPNPECGEATLNAVLNKNCKRKILALRVHCTLKDRGCQWTGKVEQLDTHLDVNSGDCQYIDIECQKCGQQVQKHQLATHITNNCPKRDFACVHCGFKATYEVVSEQHWPECQNYPVPCPNRCQIGAVERNTLEDHLNICCLQVVECDFSYAGCNEKLRRQDMEKHVEENTQKHLALMASASMKMSRVFEKKLQEQRDEFHGYLKKKERETAEQLKQKDEQIKAVEKQLQRSVREREEQIESMRKLLQKEQKEGEQQLQQQLEQKERQIKHVQEKQDHEKQLQIEALKEQIVQDKQDHEERIKAVEQRREEQIKILEVRSQQQVESIEKQLKEKEQELEQLNMKLGMPPLHFIMSSFYQLMAKDAYWYSSTMYTHTYGYKFVIIVRPNGSFSEGWHTHVSVGLNAMPGEFVATLQWPPKFTITLQLLNQYRDQDHITVTHYFQWNKPEMGTQCTIDYFTRTLIPHTDLELNAEKRTQYLKDDCLRFCITKIEASK